MAPQIRQAIVMAEPELRVFLAGDSLNIGDAQIARPAEHAGQLFHF
jgi:hypothetical protein